MKKKITLKKVFVFFLIIAYAFIFYYIQKNINSYKAAFDKNKKIIISLEGDIDLLENKNEDLLQNANHTEDMVKTYNKMGNKIAALQNDYKAAIKDVDSDKIEDIARNIKSLFVKTNSSETTPWYTAPDSYKIKYHWEFLPNYDFKGSTIPTTFICKDDKGNVLSKVVLGFDTSNKKYSDFNKEITLIGANYVDEGDVDTEGKGSDLINHDKLKEKGDEND